jgi:hypothetical protein
LYLSRATLPQRHSRHVEHELRELIERNRRLFVRDNLTFAVLDAVADPLPPGDVVIVKQVLQHLRNADVAAIVRKLAQYPTCIVCEHLPAGEFVANVDKPTDGHTRLGRGSGIVLTEAPFRVRPRAMRVLCEPCSEGGSFQRSRSISDLRAAARSLARRRTAPAGAPRRPSFSNQAVRAPLSWALGRWPARRAPG